MLLKITLKLKPASNHCAELVNCGRNLDLVITECLSERASGSDKLVRNKFEQL